MWLCRCSYEISCPASLQLTSCMVLGVHPPSGHAHGQCHGQEHVLTLVHATLGRVAEGVVWMGGFSGTRRTEKKGEKKGDKRNREGVTELKEGGHSPFPFAKTSKPPKKWRELVLWWNVGPCLSLQSHSKSSQVWLVSSYSVDCFPPHVQCPLNVVLRSCC